MLQRALAESDGTLTSGDIDKITKNYALAVPSILGEAFGLLRGQRMKTRERFALTYLGAITGLYDDFFDERGTPTERILQMTKCPEKAVANSSHEQLFLTLCLKALDYTDHKDLLLQRVEEVYLAQLNSKAQAASGNSWEALKKITFDKGGASFLYYRSAMENRASEAENLMLFTLGGTMQLENDLFDVYKDRESGVETLATNANSISELRQLYYDRQRESDRCLEATEFPKAQKVRFRNFTRVILVRGNVCLDELEKTAATTGGVFDVNAYERKQLVCDMESRKNVMASIRYNKEGV
ncbi:MAG: hypothetical protein EP346_05495 [Bacteroidetes bacterium]|nr:MAG: hypothetical protein EP346_05495 [Bacteroidota bacterium]